MGPYPPRDTERRRPPLAPRRDHLHGRGLADAYRREHHADIAGLHEPGSIRIEDYEAALVRAHAGTPRHVNVFGCSHDIDTGRLTEVARDEAGVVRRA